MVGLVGAMAVEVDSLAAKLEDARREVIGADTFITGRLLGQEVVLSVCGPGKVNAALCAQSMILRYRPDWLLNLGVAGAGASDVSIGDMVIATAVVQHDVDTSPIGDPIGMISKLNLIEIPCDPGLRERLAHAAQGLPDVRVHQGVIATGDQFIADGAARSQIHERFGALAVEMEGGAVAQACWSHGVPCGVLRSISDHANGQSEMDYPAFTRLAAAHSQRVVECLLAEYAGKTG